MQSASVTQLIANFATACRSLIPSLDLAGVPWRDEEQYDNWDRIAEPLFQSLVAEPCAFAAVGEGKMSELIMTGYGFQHSAECNAWIALANNLSQRFVTLTSGEAPFDRAAFEGPTETISLDGTELVFVFQVGDELRTLQVIDLAAE
jgi:hypothetical protein